MKYLFIVVSFFLLQACTKETTTVPAPAVTTGSVKIVVGLKSTYNSDSLDTTKPIELWYSLSHSRGNTVPLKSVSMDANGHADFGILNAGDYRVYFNTIGFNTYRYAEVQVQAGQVDPIVITWQ